MRRWPWSATLPIRPRLGPGRRRWENPSRLRRPRQHDAARVSPRSVRTPDRDGTPTDLAAAQHRARPVAQARSPRHPTPGARGRGRQVNQRREHVWVDGERPRVLNDLRQGERRVGHHCDHRTASRSAGYMVAKHRGTAQEKQDDTGQSERHRRGDMTLGDQPVPGVALEFSPPKQVAPHRAPPASPSEHALAVEPDRRSRQFREDLRVHARRLDCKPRQRGRHSARGQIHVVAEHVANPACCLWAESDFHLEPHRSRWGPPFCALRSDVYMSEHQYIRNVRRVKRRTVAPQRRSRTW